MDSKWIDSSHLQNIISWYLSISINHIFFNTHHTPGVSGHPQGSRAALQARSASVHTEVGGLVQGFFWRMNTWYLSLTNVIVIHNTIIVVVVEVWWMIIMDNMDHMNDSDNMNNDNNENINNNENNDKSYIEIMTMISMRPFLMIWTNDSDDNHIWSWMITKCIVRGQVYSKIHSTIQMLSEHNGFTMQTHLFRTWWSDHPSRVRCTTTSQGVHRKSCDLPDISPWLPKMPYGCFSKLRTVHGMGNPTESYNVGGFKGPQFEATPMIMEMNIAISCPCIDSFLTEWYQSRVFTFAARWFSQRKLSSILIYRWFPHENRGCFPSNKGYFMLFPWKIEVFPSIGPTYRRRYISTSFPGPPAPWHGFKIKSWKNGWLFFMGNLVDNTNLKWYMFFMENVNSNTGNHPTNFKWF